jgi:hypothetical protein
MKGMLRFALGALCALTIAGVYASGPPGLAGLVWQDDKIEFDLNAGNLVATGALSTTISLGNPAPVCITKATNTLNIGLDLAALTGISGLPTINLTGTALAGGSQIQWTTGPVDINLCLPASQTGLPADILIKRITGASLLVNLTLLEPALQLQRLQSGLLCADDPNRWQPVQLHRHRGVCLLCGVATHPH